MTLIQNHPDYDAEVKRLRDTIMFMDMFIESTGERQHVFRSNVKQAFVDLDHLDSSQSYITILVNAKHLDNSRENIEKVLQARDKPYFARIQFKDHREQNPAEYYIGKLTLFKENHELLIIDWRSPVASVYYEGRLGEVSYEATEGTVTGKLLSKRNYTIEDGELLDFFNMDITTNDEVLQASLRGSADDRLKDIVATIQSEQNRIIRANLEQPLIVQGVAGSGKTTIALHRIAYLIYTYEKTFKPENFMIMTPNKLFLNYISDVLPELGVEHVEQTTFTEFCFDLLKVKCKLDGSEKKLLALLNGNREKSKTDAGADTDRELIEWSSSFKGSLTFKQLIDNYVLSIEKEMLPHEDIMLEEHLILAKEEINNLFTDEFGYLPLAKRQELIKKKISVKIKHRKKEIVESIRDLYEKKTDKARLTSEDPEMANKKIVALINERDEIIARIDKKARSLAGSYIKKLKKDATLSFYRKLITEPETLLKYSPVKMRDDHIRYLSGSAGKYLKDNRLELEDLAPLVYLKSKLEGFDRKVEHGYAVIDEAQDFSLFQLFVLKHVMNTQRFTLLGDLSQGIHAYRGIRNWDDVNQQIFSEEAAFLTLQQSYRTTVEIMELANRVLQKGLGDNVITAKPVVRHGSEPERLTFSKKDELATAVYDKVAELLQEDYASIALVGKTLPECQKIKKLLEKNNLTDVPILTGEEEIYKAGIMLLPSYAAKGLEFDAVIIITLDEPYTTTNELDTKLLYVAMTRALHKLFVYTM